MLARFKVTGVVDCVIEGSCRDGKKVKQRLEDIGSISSIRKHGLPRTSLLSFDFIIRARPSLDRDCSFSISVWFFLKCPFSSLSLPVSLPSLSRVRHAHFSSRCFSLFQLLILLTERTKNALRKTGAGRRPCPQERHK